MRWLSYIWIGCLLTLSSCLKQPGNHPPVIESINLDPQENHTPGSDIIITVNVEDKDQDDLEFFWEAEGGVIHAPTRQSTVWELSTESEPFSYESITLTVSDGKDLVTETRTIQVSEGLVVMGQTMFAGTKIPVSGVEITMGKFSTFSDEKGLYMIQYLKEGNTQVTATKAGFDPFEETVYVDNPRSTFHISMTSPTYTGMLSGIIRTIDDLSFEGLKVVLLNPDNSESALYAYTNSLGSFSFGDVPLGPRRILILNESTENHFLSNSIIHQIIMEPSGSSYDVRIKIKRTLLSDSYLSEKEKWNFDGSVSDGFYLVGMGQQLELKDYITIPADAERAMFYLNSYVVGGCSMVGKLPSHRFWLSNMENEYLGGVSWGGEGGNFSAEVSWYPSEPPTFLDIYGKQIKIHLEVFEENSCVPSPLWRVYHLELSYYY